MAERCRVARRFLRYDVYRSADSRRTVEGRPSATHHLHAVYHVCRNLLQPIHSVEGGEHRARVYENLRVMTVESVNPHLCESAVLTVVFRPHTGLEVESLCQTGALCHVKELRVYHIHQVRSESPLGFASVSRHHHLVEGHVVGLQLEVQLCGIVLLYRNRLLLRLVSQIRHLYGERAFRQVLQEIVSSIVCCCPYRGSFQSDGDIGHVFAVVLVLHVSVDIGVCSFDHGVCKVFIHCHRCCLCRK